MKHGTGNGAAIHTVADRRPTPNGIQWRRLSVLKGWPSGRTKYAIQGTYYQTQGAFTRAYHDGSPAHAGAPISWVLSRQVRAVAAYGCRNAYQSNCEPQFNCLWFGCQAGVVLLHASICLAPPVTQVTQVMPLLRDLLALLPR